MKQHVDVLEVLTKILYECRQAEGRLNLGNALS
jgi:hypothetical protein